jgi:hypothetical protein
VAVDIVVDAAVMLLQQVSSQEALLLLMLRMLRLQSRKQSWLNIMPQVMNQQALYNLILKLRTDKNK